jgi:hypothetical protein
MMPVETIPGKWGSWGWIKESSEEGEFKYDMFDTL